MVPNVSKSGSSFRGAGKYYLHDKQPKDLSGDERDDADRQRHLTTDDRVAFMATRNCVNDDPHLAIDFKKGGLCKLEVETLRHGSCATLAWLLTPRQMGLMG